MCSNTVHAIHALLEPHYRTRREGVYSFAFQFLLFLLSVQQITITHALEQDIYMDHGAQFSIRPARCPLSHSFMHRRPEFVDT